MTDERDERAQDEREPEEEVLGDLAVEDDADQVTGGRKAGADQQEYRA